MIQGGTAKTGQAMVVVGLFVQTIMFGLFGAMAMIFQMKTPSLAVNGLS